jgi:hypothetical protein
VGKEYINKRGEVIPRLPESTQAVRWEDEIGWSLPIALTQVHACMYKELPTRIWLKLKLHMRNTCPWHYGRRKV